MTELEKIVLYRTYHQAEKTHRRLTKIGYYSTAEIVANFMCEIEDTWIEYGFNIGDLIYNDPYEEIASEINELPQSTYNDFVNYLNSYSGRNF